MLHLLVAVVELLLRGLELLLHLTVGLLILVVEALLVLVDRVLELLIELLLLVGHGLLRLVGPLLGLGLQLVGVLLGLGRHVLLSLRGGILQLRAVLLERRGRRRGRLRPRPGVCWWRGCG